MNDEHLDAVDLGPAVVLRAEFGEMQVQHFTVGVQEGVLVTRGGPLPDPVPVRIHSSCLFSEALKAIDCDCADQLHASLSVVAQGGGLVVYLYQEGRGAGLRMKMKAIQHQQQTGCDTVKAFQHLGLPSDPRDHKAAAEVLKLYLGTGVRIVLLTNNQSKVDALTAAGLNVVARRPLIGEKNAAVGEYLAEKRAVLGHLIDCDRPKHA
jgi:GTP cyclohydrolase II